MPRQILYCEVAGFALLILVSWLDELVGLTSIIYGGPHIPNYREASLETIVTLLVAIPIMWRTATISRRLFHLEGLLKVCAWCGRARQGKEWSEIKISHGICQECKKKAEADTPLRDQLTTASGRVRT